MSMFDDLMRLTRQLHLTADKRSQPLFWEPATDIYRVRQGWLVKMELAGVRREDVQLHTSGRVLIVHGKRVDPPIVEECTLHSLEIAYSRFERSIEFPVPLEGARVSVDYRDGMLWVRLSTSEEGQ